MIRAEHPYTDVTACLLAFFDEAVKVSGVPVMAVSYSLREASNYRDERIPSLVIYDPVYVNQKEVSGQLLQTGIAGKVTVYDYSFQLFSGGSADDENGLNFGFSMLKALDRLEALFNPVQEPSHLDYITFDVTTSTAYTGTTLRAQMIDMVEMMDLSPAQGDDRKELAYIGKFRVTFKRAENKF